ESLQVRVGRGGVEVEVALLHVLAVVAFRAGDPEEALLQDGIGAVPEGEAETEAPFPVGDPQEPILAPAVRPAARVVVWEVLPGRAARGVVLAHSTPLPLGQVRPPALPVAPARVVLGQAQRLRIVARGVLAPHPSARHASQTGLSVVRAQARSAAEPPDG